ncbi:MAG: hypothetical protein ACO1N7_04085 [Sphingobacteriaceae bacterium]
MFSKLIYNVKKLVAILFLTVHLFSTNEAYQLMKLPVVFNHFTEHKALTPTISFWAFLTLHYAKYNVKDLDYERDMQLPFKTIDHLSVPIIPAFLPELTLLLHVNSTQIILSKMYIADEFFILTDFVSGVWQPPKYC